MDDKYLIVYKIFPQTKTLIYVYVIYDSMGRPKTKDGIRTSVYIRRDLYDSLIKSLEDGESISSVIDRALEYYLNNVDVSELPLADARGFLLHRENLPRNHIHIGYGSE